MDLAQGPQRLQQVELTVVELAEVLVSGEHGRELGGHLRALPREQHPEILDGRPHAGIVQIDEMGSGIGPQQIAPVTIAMEPNALVGARPLEGRPHAVQCLIHDAGVGGDQLRGYPIVGKQEVAGTGAEALDIQGWAVAEGADGTDAMDAADEATDDLQNRVVFELWGAASAAGAQRKTVATVGMKCPACDLEGGHQRDLLLGDLQREGVLLQDCRVAPAPRAVELGDYRVGVLDPHLIDAVLVAVECQLVAVRRQSHRRHRVQDQVWSEVRVGRGVWLERLHRAIVRAGAATEEDAGNGAAAGGLLSSTWRGIMGHQLSPKACQSMRPSGPQVILLLLSLVSGLGTGSLRAESIRFFAIGDMPYWASEMGPMKALMRDAVSRGAPFIVHLGDIKSGGAPCTDTNLLEIAAVFRSISVPVVYTPGDNEWTDCHRERAGALDPLVRLRRVREVFYLDPGVLRRGELGGTDQGPDYPENFYFQRAGVMFAALHVVGSNNGFDRARADAAAEFEARDAANRVFIRRTLEAARAGGARALVLMMQADLKFDRRGPRGFKRLKEDLAGLMDEFAGPVLLLHGDTHRFEHDRPFSDPRSGEPIPRLVRVEVPGSPIVGGVWVTVDPDATEPFSAEPVYGVSLVGFNGE